MEVLEFGVPLLREGAWELWPKAQQTALHLECACFLRDLACRCGSCHGGDFVPFHRFAICSTKSSSRTSRFCSYKDTGSILTQVITDRLQLPSPQGKSGSERSYVGITSLYSCTWNSSFKRWIRLREKNRWRVIYQWSTRNLKKKKSVISELKGTLEVILVLVGNIGQAVGVCSVARSCPTLLRTQGLLLSFSVHGILQARTLEWIAISSARGSSWPKDQSLLCLLALAGRFFITEPLGEAPWASYLTSINWRK